MGVWFERKYEFGGKQVREKSYDDSIQNCSYINCGGRCWGRCIDFIRSAQRIQLGLMNSLKAQAEETILTELVFS